MESGELLRYICCKTSLNSPFLTLDLFQLFFQELSRIGGRTFGHFFRCASCHEISPKSDSLFEVS